MRTVMELNKNWYFQKENVGLPQELPCDWAKVDLPHTWNAVDGRTEEENTTAEHAGMQKALRHQSVWMDTVSM